MDKQQIRLQVCCLRGFAVGHPSVKRALHLLALLCGVVSYLLILLIYVLSLPKDFVVYLSIFQHGSSNISTVADPSWHLW